MRCWSLSCRRPSGQYVLIMVPLLTTDKLYVPQHTPVNIYWRQLCLLLYGRSFCVVQMSGTNGTSLTQSCRLMHLHFCLWACLHSYHHWSDWMVSCSFVFYIHLGHVHKLAIYLTRSLSLQRFGGYVDPHLSCRTVFHWYVSTLDDIVHKEIPHIDVFCLLGTGCLPIQHEPYATFVVLIHDILCHIVFLCLHKAFFDW